MTHECDTWTERQMDSQRDILLAHDVHAISMCTHKHKMGS